MRRQRHAAPGMVAGLALLRCAIGITGMAAPGVLVRSWTGRDANRPDVTVLARTLAARDLVLGLGCLSALGDRRTAATWLRAGGFADAVDALATVGIGRELSAMRRTLVPAMGVVSAVTSWRLAR